jgi:hypothetical protein
LYQRQEFRPLFRPFLLRLLGEQNRESCDFDGDSTMFKDVGAAHRYLYQFAELKILSPKLMLACQKPCYLGALLESLEPEFPPPKWIETIAKEHLATLENASLLRYVYLKLTQIIIDDPDRSIDWFLEGNALGPFLTLLEGKPMNDDQITAFSKLYAAKLLQPQRPVRMAAYLVIALVNAEAPVQRSSEQQRQARPKFKLPDDPAVAKYLSEALYLDSEVTMDGSYIEYLHVSRYAGDFLTEFFKRRTLLCSCLQHPALTSKLQGLFLSYDMSQPIRYQPIDYSSLKPHKRTTSLAYHIAIKRPKPVRVLRELPIEAPELREEPCYERTDQTFPTFSRFDEEVYRCEYILHRADHSNPIRYFALASMKRHIERSSSAFMSFAEPALLILASEFKHTQITGRDLAQLILSFLILCRFRREIVKRPLSDVEHAFFDESLPEVLTELDFGQIEGEPLIACLKEAVLGTNTSDAKFAPHLIPHTVPFAALTSHSHQWGTFQNSLKVLDEGYAQLWLAKANAHLPDFQRTDFAEMVIVPLLLSCRPEPVAEFLTALAKVSQKGAVEMRRRILAIF